MCTPQMRHSGQWQGGCKARTLPMQGVACKGMEGNSCCNAAVPVSLSSERAKAAGQQQASRSALELQASRRHHVLSNAQGSQRSQLAQRVWDRCIQPLAIQVPAAASIQGQRRSGGLLGSAHAHCNAQHIQTQLPIGTGQLVAQYVVPSAGLQLCWPAAGPLPWPARYRLVSWLLTR
jgi:hypothetical protein